MREAYTLSQLERFMRLFVSRSSDFAVQRSNGSYARVGRTLTPEEVCKHLSGAQTVGTYLMDESGRCTCAVFDADMPDGLTVLAGIQCQLAAAGIASYLEQSRRGGHLWVFFEAPVLASHVRSWLLPYAAAGVEFYPKQAEGSGGYGSLIRLPLGLHRRSGRRYPFVKRYPDGRFFPLTRGSVETIEWLSMHVRRATVPAIAHAAAHATPQKKSFSLLAPTIPASTKSIQAWNALQNPSTVIGRYVSLDSRSMGLCPFGEHHSHGVDRHPSLKVYEPGTPGGYCWYCYTWQQGGSVFDFLRLYYHLDARSLWKQLQREGTV